MQKYHLYIPVTVPSTQGFHNPGIINPTIFGFSARFEGTSPFNYLEVSNVRAADLDSLLARIRKGLPWAAVRLDFAIRADSEPLKYADKELFDGRFPTAYPKGIKAKPIRATASHCGQQPVTRLFEALKEADATPSVSSAPADFPIPIACELFATADFETTTNSQFLLFATMLEVLSAPAKRPQPCIDLVNELIKKAKAAEDTPDLERKEAFQSLRRSAEYLKNDSIRGSIRRIATHASQILGDPDPSLTGRLAARLYDKRSSLVHSAEPVALMDVVKIRRLAREVLAVQANCYQNIRGGVVSRSAQDQP